INGLINKLWLSQRGSNPRFRLEGTRHVEKKKTPQDPLRANRGHDRRADGSIHPRVPGVAGPPGGELPAPSALHRDVTGRGGPLYPPEAHDAQEPDDDAAVRTPARRDPQAWRERHVPPRGRGGGGGEGDDEITGCGGGA